MKDLGTPASEKDEHREKLDNRLRPIDLYKLTPKTNCGECGFASCLAFSTQVIVGQARIEVCPHLEEKELQAFRSRLADQLEAGIGVKREGFEKAFQFLRREILKWDFRGVAGSLGAEYFETDGKPALRLIYMGREVVLHADQIREFSAQALNPYEKILLYNYVIGGAVDPAGVWVGMESLPNSISKIKSLRVHCQEPLALNSAGRIPSLPAAVVGIGKKYPYPMKMWILQPSSKSCRSLLFASSGGTEMSERVSGPKPNFYSTRKCWKCWTWNLCSLPANRSPTGSWKGFRHNSRLFRQRSCRCAVPE